MAYNMPSTCQMSGMDRWEIKMRLFQEQAIVAIEPILRQAVEKLTAAGLPVDAAKAHVHQRFEFLNKTANRITTDALCEPPTNLSEGRAVRGNFFAPDSLILIKQNGDRYEDIRGSVQGQRVFIFRGDILIEAGDTLVRKMSNGGEETMRVLDPSFFERGAGSGPHYQMKVEKIPKAAITPVAPPTATSITYNFHGANARVNHNSIDQSNNVVGDHAVIHERIADLRHSIEVADLPSSDRAEALDVVDSIDEHVKAGKPKRSVMKALLASLPQISTVAKFGTEIIDLCS